MKVLIFCTLLALTVSICAAADEGKPTLDVPASTAYFQPNIEPDGTDVSPEKGLTGWANSRDHVVWYGHFSASGSLEIRLTMTLPPSDVARFRLSFDGQNRNATATGTGSAMTVSFGAITLSKTGDYRLVLEGLSKTGPTFGDLKTLTLAGDAVKDAHFSQAKTRGAPSVHLFYPTPKDDAIVAFYNEVTVKDSPLFSYYMACGFARGYFGIQVNSPTERRVIFSVWDAGDEPTDPSKVADDNRVKLLEKGAGVYAGGFGNEGTGGHSHLVYPWKTGKTYQFLVTAKPDGTATIYSGYFLFPETKKWGLIASFRAPKDGGYLRGLYSFNEDFNGANGFEKRDAEFGPQWIKTANGDWTELTSAKFSHTKDGVAERLDHAGGVRGDRFFLSNGGFSPTPGVKYGDLFSRDSSRLPAVLDHLP